MFIFQWRMQLHWQFSVGSVINLVSLDSLFYYSILFHSVLALCFHYNSWAAYFARLPSSYIILSISSAAHSAVRQRIYLKWPEFQLITTIRFEMCVFAHKIIFYIHSTLLDSLWGRTRVFRTPQISNTESTLTFW